MKKFSVIEKMCFSVIGLVALCLLWFAIKLFMPAKPEPKRLPPGLQAQYEKRMTDKAAAAQEVARARAQQQEADRIERAAKEKEWQDWKSQLPERQERFKQWALSSLPVTDFAVRDSSLFVTLTSDSYTTKPDVERIADSIAHAYCVETGEKTAVCRVYLNGKVYAKGDHGM